MSNFLMVFGVLLCIAPILVGAYMWNIMVGISLTRSINIHNWSYVFMMVLIIGKERRLLWKKQSMLTRDFVITDIHTRKILRLRDCISALSAEIIFSNITSSLMMYIFVMNVVKRYI